MFLLWFSEFVQQQTSNTITKTMNNIQKHYLSLHFISFRYDFAMLFEAFSTKKLQNAGQTQEKAGPFAG